MNYIQVGACLLTLGANWNCPRRPQSWKQSEDELGHWLVRMVAPILEMRSVI